MAHELAEKLAGLASRISDLAGNYKGPVNKDLLALGDQLTELTQAAIVEDLSEEGVEYNKALKGLDAAITFIGEADAKIDDVAKAIELASKAAALADEAIKALS